VQEHLASGVPNRPASTTHRSQKSKGRGMSGGETRKKFISLRPTLGRQWTSISKTVSKMQKYFQVYIRKMWGKGGWVSISLPSEG